MQQHYEVRLEDRDKNGNVVDSERLDVFSELEDAINFAKEMRNKYGMVVIEQWDNESLSLVDIWLESDY